MEAIVKMIIVFGGLIFVILVILSSVLDYSSTKAIVDSINGIKDKDKDKKTTNLKIPMEYLPEELTLFSPCPICGQNEHRIQWSNVSETGTYMHYNDEFTCKPFMQHECEYCGSQIYFDTNLPKDELIEWITQSCEIINTWKGKS